MSSQRQRRSGTSALQTTRAVVLRTIKYSDKSSVMRVYTERFGLRSYMVRVGSKDRSILAALQPLSRLELVAPEGAEHELLTVRDMRIDRPFTRLREEPIRGLLLLFAQEVFNRTLREETADPYLFGFIERTLEALDTGDDLAHQPLFLLVGLCKHLGFSPEVPTGGECAFDLREGYFLPAEAPHELCMGPGPTALFAHILLRCEEPLQVAAPFTSDPQVRRRLLDDLLIYYRLHVEGFGELKSLDVLRSVLA